MTPRATPPFVAGTPGRGGASLRTVGTRTSVAVRVLVWFAAIQGLFFLLPLASPSTRLLGIALALASVLAMRLLRENPTRQTVVVGILAALIAANFVGHLVVSSPNFPFRLFQLAILGSYLAALLAGALSLVGALDFRRAIVVCGAVMGLLVLAEGVVGGPADFSPRPLGSVTWTTNPVPDSVAGARFAPSSLVKSFYPDNPRGYFDEPNALQRRWTLQTFEGSQAELQFPESGRSEMRVKIGAAPGQQRWHITLQQSPLRIQAEERYEVRFRARADSSRTMFVSVGQSRSPYDGRGLFREVRVDTTWRDYAESFRATATDRDARLFFELGVSPSSVEFSSITMRAISTNRAVEAAPRREVSVSYRINSQGCRGADYPDTAASGTWRILALGDGNTFGVGVHERDTYAARLQANLNSAGSTAASVASRFEVINCGAMGYATENELQFFRQIAPRYAPNLVLLSVSPDDDRFSDEFERPSGESRPNGLHQLSRLWAAASRQSAPAPAARNYAAVMRGIQAMDAEVRARGARLVVILVRHRARADWAALDSAVTRGITSAGIPLLRLGETALPFEEQKLLVLPTVDTHPNELTHRVTADALRKFLLDKGLLGETPQ